MSSRIILHSVFASLTAALLVVACSSDDGAAPRNGVNDVRKACDIRAAWARTNTNDCINCLAGVRSQACDCPEFKDYAGLCRSQEESRLAEPTCKGVSDCVNKCVRNDCNCIDTCYVAAAGCKPFAAATEGCATDVCTQYCQ